MIALDFKIGGGKRGSVKLKRFSNSLIPNLKRGIDRATFTLEKEIKLQLSKGGSFRPTKNRPWEKNSGQHLRVGNDQLRSSWKSSPAKRVSGGVEGHVATDVPYARIHEYGGNTPAHIILPRNGKALKFFIGGAEVFAKSVNHPGSRIPKRPYVKPALDKRRGDMQEAIVKEITRPLR